MTFDLASSKLDKNVFFTINICNEKIKWNNQWIKMKIKINAII